MTIRERKLKIARLHSLIKKNPNLTDWANSKLQKLKESESEDDRIKQRIIQALHGDVLDMEETTKAIAWLERAK